MTARTVRQRMLATFAVASAVALTTAFTPALSTTSDTTTSFRPQLVTVDTPTEADKDLLTTLGLDLTEHAGHDYVEVVLHAAADLEVLEAAGLTHEVRIPDLLAREAEIQQINAAYAASVDTSALPSGRTSYRTLEDYEQDLVRIVSLWDHIARPVTLPHPSVEGKQVHGVEIGSDVHRPESGRPVFAMFGLHHAREWPSGELTIEFAYDLVSNYGTDERITSLLDQTRVIIVPVVNPDGFEKSINDGMNVDLREVDGGGTVAILGTPNNAYKRKNCRVIDGEDGLPLTCDLLKSPGGYGAGIDLNRNYGAFHGGPGASSTPPDPTYHGPDPFSEPETQNIRELVASRHVTTLVTNHTFSNLVLRPNGVSPDTIGPDGHPVGFAPDEDAMAELGARMADQNGYRNIHGWELYDTTGTTEDYSYNATGGYGYTFEIGPDEFHPPYPEVVDEYVGAGEFAGKGNREAFLIALENTVDTDHHSVLAGRAPAGATLRLIREGSFPTWEDDFTDRVETTMTVGEDGRYEWHVNPSTRPVVEARQIRVLGSEPTTSFEESGTVPAPTQHVDVPYELTVDQPDLLEINLTWDLPDDMDLEVYRDLDANGTADAGEPQVGSSGAFVGEKERVLLEGPAAGDYVIRVINWASVSPTWTVTAETFDTDTEIVPGLVEAWTLRCEVDGEVLEQTAVVVDRGASQKVSLNECRRAARRR